MPGAVVRGAVVGEDAMDVTAAPGPAVPYREGRGGYASGCGAAVRSSPEPGRPVPGANTRGTGGRGQSGSRDPAAAGGAGSAQGSGASAATSRMRR